MCGTMTEELRLSELRVLRVFSRTFEIYVELGVISPASTDETNVELVFHPEGGHRISTSISENDSNVA